MFVALIERDSAISSSAVIWFEFNVILYLSQSEIQVWNDKLYSWWPFIVYFILTATIFDHCDFGQPCSLVVFLCVPPHDWLIQDIHLGWANNILHH